MAALALFGFVAKWKPCTASRLNYVHLTTYAAAMWSAGVVLFFELHSFHTPQPEQIPAPPTGPPSNVPEPQPEPEPEPEPEPDETGLRVPAEQVVVLLGLGWLILAVLWLIPKEVWKVTYLVPRFLYLYCVGLNKARLEGLCRLQAPGLLRLPQLAHQPLRPRGPEGRGGRRTAERRGRRWPISPAGEWFALHLRGLIHWLRIAPTSSALVY